MRIYQNRYFVRVPQGYAGAGSCGIHPDGPERNPLEKGIVEPDWHIYNEKVITKSMCRNAVARMLPNILPVWMRRASLSGQSTTMVSA